MKRFFSIVFFLIPVPTILSAQVSEGEVTHPGLRNELNEMREADQAMRISVSESLTTVNQQEQFEQLMALDASNTRRLQEIVTEYGWPTITMVGQEGSLSALLLVQHADQNRTFQSEVLTLIKPLLIENEALLYQYAYLYDRVNDPQLYGTQGSCKGPGNWEPDEIEDLASVDTRREEMGIIPVQLTEYIQNMSEQCR